MTKTIPGLLTRFETGDQGTFGVLEVGGLVLNTVELPWRDNRQGVSCTPAGKSFYAPRVSPSHGPCLEEWDDPATPEKEDVPGRTLCQFHSANLAGDVEKGYVSELLGCTAPGLAIVTFPAGKKPAGAKAQKGVSRSKIAMQKLLAEVGDNVLSLTTVWKEGVLDGHPGGY